MLFSLLEHFIEIFLFPGLKEHWWLSNLGLAVVIVGEIISKTSIIRAGQAFTHNWLLMGSIDVFDILDTVVSSSGQINAL